MAEASEINEITQAKALLIMNLRSLGVRDIATLTAVEKTPREAFIPPVLQKHAYDNVSLPISHGQTISQPYVVAVMTENLNLTGKERVLEIGTGTGYQTAVLSHICRRVYTIERIRPLLVEAERRFTAQKITNVTTRLGDGARGWPEAQPFDRIIITCASPTVPETLMEQLKDDGVMIVPVGESRGGQKLKKITWDKNRDKIVIEDLLDVRFVPLLPDIIESGNS